MNWHSRPTTLIEIKERKTQERRFSRSFFFFQQREFEKGKTLNPE